MHIHIDTTNDVERERATRLMQYALVGHSEDINSVHLTITKTKDALGTELTHCNLRARLRRDQAIEVKELQSSFDLAVTRALERGIRAVHRKLGIETRHH